MQQIKIFKTIESELHPMEDEINRWIAENKIKVISITGNIASQTQGSHVGSFSASDVLLVVLYDDESSVARFATGNLISQISNLRSRI